MMTSPFQCVRLARGTKARAGQSRLGRGLGRETQYSVRHQGPGGLTKVIEMIASRSDYSKRLPKCLSPESSRLPGESGFQYAPSLHDRRLSSPRGRSACLLLQPVSRASQKLTHGNNNSDQE